MPLLLRLQRAVPQAELDSILRLCKELGFECRSLPERPELLELVGKGNPSTRARLLDMTGVREILDAGDLRELHQRAPGAEDTAVRVGDALFGAGNLGLIAGPCAVEDEIRLLDIATSVRRAGATLLRGGAFKPRTSPYAFQGLGQEGLDILARIKDATGLGIVTEVLDPRDIDAVSRVADMVQVGARSMTNFALLKELGQTRKPVLLKRGFGATVREFLDSAEYLLAGGNEQVVLCERGIRSFDTITRNVLDVGAIAHLKGATHLPVIVDPSHAAGRADLVRPLARAGIAAGADGMIVEVHPAPAEVRSDGAQAVSLQCFESIVRDTEVLAEMDGRRLLRSTHSEARPGGVIA
ncbi:MAG: 3-deoxy-7-phosphoheptulonate synthase [Planctomycetota bacterium]|jgi:3-deoxy-7-phosphoheptulonate synthase